MESFAARAERSFIILYSSPIPQQQHQPWHRLSPVYPRPLVEKGVAESDAVDCLFVLRVEERIVFKKGVAAA